MGKKISPLKIGIRCQDIQTSLQDISLGPLISETENIRLLGMAERLAIHIRGVDVIDDYKKLKYVAGQFGIDSLILPRVLETLEEIGWVRVQKRVGEIVKVEESVPYFKDVYSEVGEYYNSTPHSEIEDAIIETTDKLALSPINEETIKKELGKKLYKIVLDIGKSGKFIEEYDSPDTEEKILYSPIYWVENPKMLEEIYKLLKQFGAENVIRILREIQNYQGRPLTDRLFKTEKGSLSQDDQILFELIKRGIILAPQVDSFRGRKSFAFTPYPEISIEEKVILEKAMAILACVRYGEHFGLITKIKYPEAILDKLLNPPHIIGPHTEIRKQYAILVGRGIGRIYPATGVSDRWYFRLIDKEENIKAVKLAKDLLVVGEAISDRGFQEELQKILFTSGSYEEALRTLPKLKEPTRLSSETQEHILNSIMDVLRTGGRI